MRRLESSKTSQIKSESHASNWLMESLPFKRPSTADPTRFLLIQGFKSREDVAQMMETFSCMREVVQMFESPSQPVLVLECSDTDVSQSLLKQYKGRELNGRKLNVQFTEQRSKGNPSDPADYQTEAVRDAARLGVPGLTVIHDFITQEEEAHLIQHLDTFSWEALAKRRVQHHGHIFDYATRSFGDSLGSLPEFLRPTVSTIESAVRSSDPESSDLVWTVDQVTANEYESGVGISPHIDTHQAFAGAIVSLSLLTGTVIEFRRDGVHKALYVPPRALLIMGGESRYAWAHYIPHRRSDVVEGQAVVRGPRRVSLTVRMVRPDRTCRCKWAEYCDSQMRSIPPTRLAANAKAPTPRDVTHSGPFGDTASTSKAPAKVETASLASLEEQFVHQVYEAIAPHFSATRFAVWPEVRRFLDDLSPGALVADVGCGNGKYLGVRPDVAVLGSDRSSGLVQLAHARVRGEGAASSLQTGGRPLGNCDACVADGMGLPYRSSAFDAVICIAVLHHISSPARRVHMLRELLRLLRPGGRALVTVWATDQQDPKKLAKWKQIGIESSNADDAAMEEEYQGPPKDGVPAVPTDAGSADVGGDYFVPWHLPLHRAEAAAAASGPGTSAEGAPVLDKSKHAVVYQRYYHLFTQAETEDVARAAGGCEVVRCFYDKDNWCLIVEKK